MHNVMELQPVGNEIESCHPHKGDLILFGILYGVRE